MLLPQKIENKNININLYGNKLAIVRKPLYLDTASIIRDI